MELDMNGPIWGAISWRKAARYDSPEDQLAGFKVMPTFSKPQFRHDVQRYVDLQSNQNDWIEPYRFEIVPFERQSEAVEAKRAELAHLEEMRKPHPDQALRDAEATAVLTRSPGPSRPWKGD
jgi:hypothetical protein